MALSISGCFRIKFSTESGRMEVSFIHTPGRGSGTFEFRTGSQAEFDIACSLNFPKNKKFLCKKSYKKLIKGNLIKLLFVSIEMRLEAVEQFRTSFDFVVLTGEMR